MPSAGSDPDPFHLLREVAGRLLDDSVPELTERAVRRLQQDEPAYRSSQVSLDDLTRMMSRTLSLALMRIAGRELPDAIRTSARDAGRLRAQQGLPLAALLHAYRIDLLIIWEAIIDEVKETEPDSALSFLASSVLVWDAVEANTAEVVDAYRQAEREVAERLEETRREAFDLLLREGERSASAVREASVQLQMPLEGVHLALVAANVTDTTQLAALSTARLRQAGIDGYATATGGDLLVLAAFGSRPVSEVLELLPELGAVRTAGALGSGLVNAPRTLRLARRVLRGMGAPGVRLLHESWISTVVHSDEELGRDLGESVLGGLLALPPSDRDAVLEVVEAYLRTGSVADVALELYRHRNTVRNRLQTAERLSGLDLSRPDDLATMTLALAWMRGPSGPPLAPAYPPSPGVTGQG
jgi:hypothetical protein